MLQNIFYIRFLTIKEYIANCMQLNLPCAVFIKKSLMEYSGSNHIVKDFHAFPMYPDPSESLMQTLKFNGNVV
jgi:hypothetical protein